MLLRISRVARCAPVVVILLMLSATFFAVPPVAMAQSPTPTPERLLDQPLSGEPAFPITSRTIPYWIVNCPVLQGTVESVDSKLESLNVSRKTQTVILCMPYGEVHDGVLYAISFYNYMQLGYTNPEYRDRGFVWLVQVDATRMKINYSPGEGLPKLDPGEIDVMRDNAVAMYLDTGNLDLAMTELTDEYVESVTSQYPEVAVVSVPSPQTSNVSTQEQGSGGLILFVLFIGLILVVMGVVLFLWGGSGSTNNNENDDNWQPTRWTGSNNDMGRQYDSPPAHHDSPPAHHDSPPAHHDSPPAHHDSPPSGHTGAGGSNARRGG